MSNKHKNKSVQKDKEAAALQAKTVMPWQLIALCGLFMVFCVITAWKLKYDAETLFAVGTAMIFLLMLLKKENRAALQNSVTPILILLFAQCALYFAGLFYAAYPQYALQKFLLNAGGFFVFAVLYISISRDKKNITRLLTLLSACIAGVSLVSIELATSGFFLRLFGGWAASLGGQLDGSFGQFEQNTRITTVMDEPNIFAAVAAVGMLSALFLFHDEQAGKKRRAAFLWLSMICAATFVLCFSLGAIVALAPALLLGIFLLPKGEKGPASVSLLYCLLCAFVSAAVVFAVKDRGALPLLAVIVISAGFSLAYVYLKPTVHPSELKKNKIKKVIMMTGAGTICLFIAAAMTMKGPYSLTQDEGFRRAVALKPGEYTMHLQTDGSDASANVVLSSMSYTQAAMKEQTTLKEGTVSSGQALAFTVPESSAAVFFTVRANDDLTIEKITLSTEENEKAVALKYFLIPEFIVNRLQGIWVNDNAIQRFVFFRDGIRMGLKSPIIGLGGGAFEGYLFGIAEYYYVTNHPHNQYIQSFIDGGVIGLSLFLSMAIIIAAGLFKARKRYGGSKYLALIGGVISMIYLHALIEVDFMHPAFRLLTAVFLAMAAAEYFKERAVEPGIKKTAFYATCVLLALSLLFGAGRLQAVKTMAEGASEQNLSAALRLDPVNSYSYKLSYLLAMKGVTQNSEILARSSTYAESLEKARDNSVTDYYLTQYYLQKAQPEAQKAAVTAMRYIRSTRVSPDAWDGIFALYNTALETASAEQAQLIQNSIMELCGYLRTINAELPKDIVPKLAASDYLWASLRQNGTEDDLLVDARLPCDLNNDGKSDLIIGEGDGKVTWTVNMIGPPLGQYIIKVYQNEAEPCEVTVYDLPQKCQYDSGQRCFVSNISVSAPGFDIKLITGDDANTYFTVEPGP